MLLQTRVVFVQGLPQNATEDTVLNYFENSRLSGGGAVEEVKIKGNVARVRFESSEGNCIVCVVDDFFLCKSERRRVRKRFGMEDSCSILFFLRHRRPKRTKTTGYESNSRIKIMILIDYLGMVK